MTTSSTLRAPVPDGFELVEDEPQLTLLQRGDLRSPMRIVVRLAEQPPSLDAPRKRALGDVEGVYTIDELDGGSGGPVHVLRAYKLTDRGAIVLEAEAQQETGTPDFAAAWSVLEGAR
ncbi:MAG: Tsi3 family protein [Nannocystaceae bacterium]|nr:Tsi3 family protein [bacterium]